MPVSRILPVDRRCASLNYVAVNTVIAVRPEEPSNATVTRGTRALSERSILLIGAVLMTRCCAGIHL